MGPFVAKVPDWFSARLAAQVTAFFAIKSGGRINILRATKLIYLSDRASMEHSNRPITGDSFVLMPFGPVNTYTLSFMDGEAVGQNDDWSSFIGRRDGYEMP